MLRYSAELKRLATNDKRPRPASSADLGVSSGVPGKIRTPDLLIGDLLLLSGIPDLAGDVARRMAFLREPRENHAAEAQVRRLRRAAIFEGADGLLSLVGDGTAEDDLPRLASFSERCHDWVLHV